MIKITFVSMLCVSTLFSLNAWAQLDVSAGNSKGAPNDSVTIPVLLSNSSSQPVDAFGFKLTFPGDLLIFLNVGKAGTLTDEWIQVSGSEVSPGVVTIGGFHTTAITSSGTLLTVTFIVKSDAKGQGVLSLSDFVDDLSGASTTNANFVVSSFRADFSSWVRKGRVPFIVDFDDNSSGNITSWMWDFGDGQSSTLQDPSHRYDLEGVYSVSLTIAGAEGTNSLLKQNYVTVLPVPPFDLSAGNILVQPDSLVTVPLMLTNQNANILDAFGFKIFYPVSLLSFVEISTTGSLTEDWMQINALEPTTGVINIGGYHTSPITSGGKLLDIKFMVNSTATGLDSLELRNMVDDLAPATTLDAIIKIGKPMALKADFSASPKRGNAPLKVNFINLSTGRIAGWKWDFGDGHTTTTENPEYIYHNQGVYTVTLSILSSEGIDTEEKIDFLTVLSTTNVNAGASSEVRPNKFVLYQNFPNPFNMSTTFKYNIPYPSNIQINIYDINGRPVRQFNAHHNQPGFYQFRWNGNNSRGETASNGVYFVRLVAKDFCALKKAVLIK